MKGEVTAVDDLDETEKTAGRRAEWAFLTVTGAAGIALLVHVEVDLGGSETHDPIGIAAFPRLAAALIVIGVVMSAIEAFRNSDAVADTSFSLIAGSVPAIAALAYVYGLRYIGFVVATVTMLLGFLYVTGERDLRILIGIPVIGTVVLHFFFRVAISMFIPSGWLF